MLTQLVQTEEHKIAFSLNAEKEHIVILLSLSETEHLICKSADSERENTTLLLAC